MFCKSCGKQISSTSRFCPECGANTIAPVNVSSQNSEENNNGKIEYNKIFKKDYIGIITIVLLVILLLVAFFNPLKGSVKNSLDINNSMDAMMEMFKTGTFPGFLFALACIFEICIGIVSLFYAASYIIGQIRSESKIYTIRTFMILSFLIALFHVVSLMNFNSGMMNKYFSDDNINEAVLSVRVEHFVENCKIYDGPSYIKDPKDYTGNICASDEEIKPVIEYEMFGWIYGDVTLQEACEIHGIDVYEIDTDLKAQKAAKTIFTKVAVPTGLHYLLLGISVLGFIYAQLMVCGKIK